MKMNGLILDEDKTTKLTKYIEDKITARNATTFYQLAKLYKLKRLAHITLIYIERWFSMVDGSQNFLEMEFCLVAKVLSSSELNVHSELEIFDAATDWLKYDITERVKYATQLLSKVRVFLLSDHAIKHILNSLSSLNEDNECVEIIRKSLVSKKNFSKNKSINDCTSRYCSQEKFNILIFGGYDYKRHKVMSNVKLVDGSDLNNVKILPPMKEARMSFEAVFLKGDVYVFGGRRLYGSRNFLSPVEQYSFSTNKWRQLGCMPIYRHQLFCACAFIDKIFIIGGYLPNDSAADYCLQIDTIKYTWKTTLARMNEARYAAACACFEGRVVVAGGKDDHQNSLNSVESYDVAADEWSAMPSMIEGKIHHSLIVARSKLFAMARSAYTCEVFDGISKKFVALKKPQKFNVMKGIAVGNKILFFSHLGHNNIVCYDVDKNEWSEESNEVAKDLEGFSCLKLPWY